MKILIDITMKLSDTEGRRNLKRSWDSSIGATTKGRMRDLQLLLLLLLLLVVVSENWFQFCWLMAVLSTKLWLKKVFCVGSWVSQAPLRSCQRCSQQQPTTMMMAEKRADASVKHSRVQERAHQSGRQPSGKKPQKTVLLLRLPARPPKRALTFSRYLSC
jgi:hypothetical protein